ncbi:MAG: DUF111 family protein [Candidatus Micrarchaeota archaeon]|nr:DUF111 family protein [Candidatus Micrarchaeota archaeon]
MARFFFIPEMGCSGDMVLGALADLGVEEEMRSSIKLALGVDVSFKDVNKNGVRAKILEGDADEKCSPQKMAEMIRSSVDILGFDDEQCDFVWNTFETIIGAERRIHGFDEVHLSEIGNMNTVVDIIGSAIGLAALGAFESDVITAPLAVGKKPAPATIEILKSRKFSFYTKDIEHELCTLTGASIMVNIADGVGKIPHIGVYKEGCGGGKKNFQFPNVLRLRIL